MTEPDGLPTPRRHWAVASVLLGSFLGTLDSAIANIALPTITQNFATQPAATVWVVTAYQLTMAVFLLPISVLGEVFGFRRVYCVGLVIFTLASLGCALAPSLTMLVLARGVQGVGSSCLSALGGALMRHTYPRAKFAGSVALFGLTVAISAALGPSIAAGILSVASWRWLFAINIPLAGFCCVIGFRALPQTSNAGLPIDGLGFALNIACFTLFIIGLDTAGASASRGVAAAELLASGLLGYILYRQQRSQARPMVPLDLLRIPIFALSTVTSICSYAAQILAYVSLPFLLETMLGRSEVETGLLVTPWPLIIVVVAPLAGHLSNRYSAGILCSIGLVAMASGLGLLALMPEHASNLDIAWRTALCGAGFGFFQTPNNRVLLLSGPVERSGAASGALATARMIGLSGGAALVALIFQIGGGGGRATLVVACVFAAVGALVSSLRLRDRGPSAFA